MAGAHQSDIVGGVTSVLLLLYPSLYYVVIQVLTQNLDYVVIQVLTQNLDYVVIQVLTQNLDVRLPEPNSAHLGFELHMCSLVSAYVPCMAVWHRCAMHGSMAQMCHAWQYGTDVSCMAVWHRCVMHGSMAQVCHAWQYGTDVSCMAKWVEAMLTALHN